MKFNRIWAMPSKNTYTIKPIRELIERYINLIDNEDWQTFYQHITLDAHPTKSADKEIIG